MLGTMLVAIQERQIAESMVAYLKHPNNVARRRVISSIRTRSRKAIQALGFDDERAAKVVEDAAEIAKVKFGEVADWRKGGKMKFIRSIKYGDLRLGMICMDWDVETNDFIVEIKTVDRQHLGKAPLIVVKLNSGIIKRETAESKMNIL